MKCPKCGAKTYRTKEGKDACPSCGYGRAEFPAGLLGEARSHLAETIDPDLEARMRPGRLSEKGFLGPDESLAAVLARDAETLERLGVTHEEVAGAIERVISAVLQQRNQLQADEYWKRRANFPDLYHPETIPRFSLKNLPDTDTGYLVGHLQVFALSYRGLQECPWGCDEEPKWSHLNLLFLNRRTGESFTAPGLAVHLIRAHHFFEGLGTPFRVDPAMAVRVLELAPV